MGLKVVTPPMCAACEVGEAIWLTDGAGVRWEGVVSEVRRGALDVEVRRVAEDPRGLPRLVAVQALAKGGRDEAAVEAMTEVGVDEIVGVGRLAQHREVDRSHCGEMAVDRRRSC